LRTIWGGEDYVPGVWEEWLNSGDGQLIVAEYEHQPAGLARLRDLGSGEWWMEGLRVDPHLQGLGIASRLHDYLLERWLESDGTVVRLATHSRRLAVQHLCERTGFEPIARLGHFHARARDGQHAFVQMNRSALPGDSLGYETVTRSVTGERLMDLDWAWATLRGERIDDRQGSSLWSWRDGKGWVVLLQPSPASGEEVLLQACDVIPGDQPDFFSDLCSLTGWLDQPGIRFFTGLQQAGEDFWDGAGWTMDPDEDLLLFERRR